MSQNFMGLTTIDELLNWTYNRTPDEIMKANYSTGDAGNYNPLYGAAVWANFNLEANIFAAMPKYVWDFSGWRIFSAKAATITNKIDGTSAAGVIHPLGGTDEGADIAQAEVPPVVEINVKPKTLQYAFEATEVLEQLVDHSRDDNYGSLAQQRVYASDQFKERVNLMLAYEPINNPNTTNESTGSAFNLESLARIVSSKAEGDFYDPSLTTAYASGGSHDPWNYTGGAAGVIDRSAATTFDSTIRSTSGTIGTPDVLTDSLIRTLLADLRTAGGKEPTVMIGGQDTYSEVQSIYMNAYRIQNTVDLRTEFSTTVNGVETFTGTGAGLHISTVYGLPLIPSKDNPTGLTADGNAGDLYILNTNSDKTQPGKPLLGIQVLKPTVYYEAGKRTLGYPYINGKFVDRALYESMMETTCRNFKAQGKIIDIQSTV